MSISGGSQPVEDLRPGELRVYVVDLELSVEQRLELAGLLSTDERKRAARFIRERDRERFEIARGMLRRILAPLVANRAENLRFTYGPQGKPYLLGDPGRPAPPAFNVSHSGGVALIAVGRDVEIGIDVERLRHIDHALLIAKRYFSSAETAILSAVPEDDLDGAFFRCWTRKEAYIKGRGVGLQCPLCSFTVSAPDHFLPDGWRLAPLHLDPWYVGAIATTGRSELMRTEFSPTYTRVVA